MAIIITDDCINCGACNAQRLPETLQLKYRLMYQNVFRFFRGTCHLYYEDYAAQNPYPTDPTRAWISGDLHLENFGSYKGNNRLVYFDINDFDEAALAPCSWELTRFVTGLLLAANVLKLKQGEGLRLSHLFLDTYAATLVSGKARLLERDNATGLVHDFLTQLKTRTRKSFLKKRICRKKDKWRLKIDGKRTLKLPKEVKKAFMAWFETWRIEQPNPHFYKLHDVALRIAGTSSLGLHRYVLLVEGRGGADGLYLLDFKEARSTALAPYLTLAQPAWHRASER